MSHGAIHKDRALTHSLDAASDRFRHRAAAAAKVFCDYGDFIRNVIYAQIQDEDRVDDLTQAFSISLITNPMPEGVQNVKAYLYKKIINDITDANRRTRRYRCFTRKYAEVYECPAGQAIPNELAQAEEVERVYELIENRLPHSEARAVTLRYQEHHSVREAAEKMGVDDMTLRGYVCEGLGRIRRLLKNIEADVTE